MINKNIKTMTKDEIVLEVKAIILTIIGMGIMVGIGWKDICEIVSWFRR